MNEKLGSLLLALCIVAGCDGTNIITGRDQGIDPYTSDPGFDPDEIPSDDDEGTPPRKPSSQKDGGSTSTKSGTATTDAGSSSTPSGSGGACSSQTSFDACDSCCFNLHPNGFDVWQNAFGSCACEQPGTCASRCGNSYCVGQDPAPGGSCEQCLDGASQCAQIADSACNADPDCAAYLACFYESGCDKKP